MNSFTFFIMFTSTKCVRDCQLLPPHLVSQGPWGDKKEGGWEKSITDCSKKFMKSCTELEWESRWEKGKWGHSRNVYDSDSTVGRHCSAVSLSKNTVQPSFPRFHLRVCHRGLSTAQGSPPCTSVQLHHIPDVQSSTSDWSPLILICKGLILNPLWKSESSRELFKIEGPLAHPDADDMERTWARHQYFDRGPQERIKTTKPLWLWPISCLWGSKPTEGLSNGLTGWTQL